jgi:hypothetical protein
MTRLGKALRARFKTPHECLAALGLDADNLLATPVASGGSNDPMKELRVALENLMGDLDMPEGSIGKILELLDKHVPFDRVSDDDPNAERIHELAGAADEDEDGDDDGVERVEKARALMAKAGLSKTDIADVIAIAQGGAKTVGDRLPTSGPGGQGGYRSDRDRHAGEPVFAHDSVDKVYDIARIIGERTRDTHHDRRPPVDEKALNLMYPGFEDIGVGAR